MDSFNFKKWNNVLGWFVFTIALSTYWLTVEPTASFWDAGEYITTSSNLEVGHPPGAPLYQILGAFFSIFALEATNIALTINLMSVFASAFTILFMFWSLTMLLTTIVSRKIELKKQNYHAILGSAAIGSLAFAFSDSFWFNAVEAEVYAMATFIMSVLFYLALRWERDMNTPRGDRWVILIAFVIGLSFGVHFMGLLTIPAMGMLYFFKNYKSVTLKNFLIANIVMVAILLFIFKLLLPMTLKFFSASEIFFVNSIGLPFNSGTIIAGFLFTGLFYYLLRFTREKEYVKLNTLLLAILFIFIGFSSWIMLPVRANAGTMINENNPNNARELLAYYNREQYPETHLFYGPLFTEKYVGLDPKKPYKDDKPKFEKDEENGKYIIVNDFVNASQNTDDAQKGLFPRMWSMEHATNYMQFTDGLEFTIKREYLGESRLIDIVKDFNQDIRSGNVGVEDLDNFLKDFGPFLDIQKPTFLQNIAYMFEYQFGYMYWRYFMWNFSGRQDDKQGEYTDLHGNWLTGINFIDDARLGPQEFIASDSKHNKARNTYFMLPLLLGIIGILFHYKNDPKNFWVLLIFFLFTGIALKIYLNERPFEPRERDYALVGSFYVFAMWIGFGVYALFEIVKEKIKPKLAVPIVLASTALAVPVLMGSQNWDDHDRSNRYTAQSMAKMYLDSCDENAIIFTIGDNDTFALWYAQGIEGYRQDVRIVNTSLFQTDWYIDDMKKKAFDSDPIPSQLSHDKYKYGSRDFLFFQKTRKDTINIKDWMDFVANDSKKTQVELESRQWVNTFPTKVIKIPVDKEAVLQNGIVDPKDADKIVPNIYITLKGDVIYKNRLLMLDVIANNNWERPIYFSGGAFGDDDYIWMKEFLQLEGVLYKLVPIRTPLDKNNPYEMGRIDGDKMYNIVMNWKWGNSGDSAIYHDVETRRNGITYRSTLSRLANVLIEEGQNDKAENVLDLAMEKMPVDYFEFYSLLEPFILYYYQINKVEKARAVYQSVVRHYQEHLFFYSKLSYNKQEAIGDEIFSDLGRYRGLLDVLASFDNQEYTVIEAEKFNEYLQKFNFSDNQNDLLEVEEEIFDDGLQDSLD
ncbi:MAG: DUF2723 domain-containing protein [Flavobacteriaceae bacterium]|nr:DUF2723 domain-containing protein [Flavobacteriaceae bacterium]